MFRDGAFLTMSSGCCFNMPGAADTLSDFTRACMQDALAGDALARRQGGILMLASALKLP